MNRFLIGFVLVFGLMLTGCAKKTDRKAADSASTVQVKKDEALPSEIDGVDVEPQKDKENFNAIAGLDGGVENSFI